jgi:catechol-2,3-dioxygenase
MAVKTKSQNRQLITQLWETNIKLQNLQSQLLYHIAILQGQIQHLQDQINEITEKGEKR